MRTRLLFLSFLVCSLVSAQPLERFAFTTQAGVAKRVALFEDGNISFLSPPDLMAESPMIRPGTQDVFYLVTTGSNERAIYSTNAKTKDTKSWSPEGVMEGGMEFSPDGNYLYFVSTRSGSPGVFRRDLRSGNIETIADGPWPEFDPRLSVDGRELLYVEWTDDGYYLHSWNTENRSQRQVLHDSLLISNVRWSKNDYSFVYIRNEAPYWEIREYFPLRDSTFSVRWGVPTMADPVFSPNGEQIFYSMEHDGQWDIFAYRRSSDKHRGIIAGKKDDLKPRFHPSGDWIWYNEKTKDGWRIMKKVIRGKSPRPMINGKEFSCFDAVWFPPEE